MKIDIKKVLGIGVGVLTVAASILAAFTNKDEFSDFLENATDDELVYFDFFLLANTTPSATATAIPPPMSAIMLPVPKPPFFSSSGLSDDGFSLTDVSDSDDSS